MHLPLNSFSLGVAHSLHLHGHVRSLPALCVCVAPTHNLSICLRQGMQLPALTDVSQVPIACLMLQIVSTMATTSLEGVAAASQGSPLIIFQLYVQRDRDFTASLIRSKTVELVAYNPWDADLSEAYPWL